MPPLGAHAGAPVASPYPTAKGTGGPTSYGPVSGGGRMARWPPTYQAPYLHAEGSL
jgi:hypothetical protein